ncbi:hypothetical protein CEUSTIGMA_g10662.t1 [Chlamydomonas eustigma]|uniref:HMA domain-containing protein n=1 Tax=Chlamydomonas eustigma TaxID=1157962 RepID=A0A250XJP2_9CHLO|nr:hypothetical protein CEUSTIGMA_g10662.t1 [Chlamydomonas eustigma]|eukprot:GAX83236.1 hypothetical protein CEUSTIGMA_g10662.t1 [Chlamydomonas eustigma]
MLPFLRPQRSSTALMLSLRPVIFAAGLDDTVEIELKIEGMMCGGCTGRVEEALKNVKDVCQVSVNLETKLALIEVRAASQLDALALLPSIVDVVKELGFEAEPHFS